MIELVLSEDCEVPSVQCFIGPRITVTMNVRDDMRRVLAFLQPELMEAMKWAITTLYASDNAPDRIYMRDPQGDAMSVLVDPCKTLGLNAVVGSDNLQRFKNFGR